jgi:DDE superfamily endonuclease/Helix-turn-helix of DDE superfamily endonuclease
MNIEKMWGNPRLLRAATSLDRSELEQLVFPFEREWLKAQRRGLTERGTERVRALGAGRKGQLASIRHKLLFILMYFKLYPLQEVMGLLFGFNQSEANRWIHRLTPVLEKALGRTMALPARRPADLQRVLAECPSLEFVLDGVERPVRRPKDKDRQKRHYSGKKKRHGLKNLVVTHGGKIKGLSRTMASSVHDKKLADQTCWRWPRGGTLLMDTGFTGYTPPRTDVLMPHKKPKGKPLDAVWKMINRGISRLRVRVEHAIAGIKRCHVVADVYRNTKAGFEDAVMLSACGLHNFRVACRAAA